MRGKLGEHKTGLNIPSIQYVTSYDKGASQTMIYVYYKVWYMYIIYHFTGNEDDSKFFVPQDSNTAFEGENFNTCYCSNSR